MVTSSSKLLGIIPHMGWSSCFWLKGYPYSFIKEGKLKPQSLPKKVPPFVLSGGPALSLPRARPAPYRPLFWGRGTLMCRGERPIRKHTFLFLPTGCLAPQLRDSWRGWKLAGRGCHAVAWEQRSWKRNGSWWLRSLADIQTLAKSNLHRKTSELQKETRKTKKKKEKIQNPRVFIHS